jgi:hypothetical protein
MPMRISLLAGGAAKPGVANVVPAMAASASAAAALRRGAVTSRRRTSRATDPDRCPAPRVFIKPRILPPLSNSIV